MVAKPGFASIEPVHVDGDIVNAYIIATKFSGLVSGG